MRARGADITDITVIVVAADDGCNAATVVKRWLTMKAADVPIIVAVNKIDKPAANPGRVMQEPFRFRLPQKHGVGTIFVEILSEIQPKHWRIIRNIFSSWSSRIKSKPQLPAFRYCTEARLDKNKRTYRNIY